MSSKFRLVHCSLNILLTCLSLVFAQTYSNSRSAFLLFRRSKACLRTKALYDNLTEEEETNYWISDGARLSTAGNESHDGTRMRLQKHDAVGPLRFYNGPLCIDRWERIYFGYYKMFDFSNLIGGKWFIML